MEQSPRLSLSYVAPAQAQKHVTVNETFRRLDALVQLTVLSRVVAAEPAAPAEGDGYILPASPTGAAWDNYAAGDVAVFQDGAWISIESIAGLRAFVIDEGDLVAYDGAGWSAIATGEESDKFGVNATADATNRLSVKSDAVLFSHDDVTPGSGDARVKVNKDAAGDTASHLFQTGFSGRAEFGLLGDDDFAIKVSPDNFATAFEVLKVDKDNGCIGLGGAAPNSSFKIETDGGARFTVSAPAVGQNFSIIDSDSGGVSNVFSYIYSTKDFIFGTGAGDGRCRASVFRPETDNSIPLGNATYRWSVVYSATGTINTSDERGKRNVRPCDLGLSFVRDLEPIRYRHKKGGTRIVGVDPETDEPIVETREGVRTHYGLSAQRVRAAVVKHGAEDFAGWVLTDKNDPNSTQGLRYDQFIPPLIKAVQELATRVEALETRRTT